MDCPTEPCIVCAGTDFARRYDFEVAAIWSCTACGMMLLWPQPTEQHLHAVYDDSYYKNDEFLENHSSKLYGYVDYLSEKRHRRLELSETFPEARRLLGVGEDERPRMFEVGCGLGHLLDAAHDAGFEAEGLEYNRWAYDFISRKYRFPMYFGDVCSADLQAGTYDLVCMFDVIEHLPDPAAAIDRMAELLRPGGLCLIETMDSNSFVSRLLGKRLEDFRRIREHLYFFDRPTLSRFLADRGLHTEQINSVGHTFELGFLLDRLALISPLFFGWMKRLLYPRWLLRTTVYVDGGTKMLVWARKEGGQSTAD